MFINDHEKSLQMFTCCRGTFDFAGDSSLSNVLLLTADSFANEASDEARF